MSMKKNILKTFIILALGAGITFQDAEIVS